MEEILRHPEIINPYRLDRDSSKDWAFVEDLGLNRLLDSVPFYSSDSKQLTKQLAREVLVNLGSNMNTVEYRQDIFQDLFSDHNLRNIIQEYVKRIDKLERKLILFNGKPNWLDGLALVRSFKDFFCGK